MKLPWLKRRLSESTVIAVALVVAAGCARRVLCVAEGSFISTPHGSVAIESLRLGDALTVVSQDGSFHQGFVTAMLSSVTNEWIVLWVQGGGAPLRVTAPHQIRTPRGWRKAGTLVVGDSIVTHKGIRAIDSLIVVSGEVRVFDIDVEPHHAFIADGVIVHNKSIAEPPRPLRVDVIGNWSGVMDEGTSYAQLEVDSLVGVFAMTHWWGSSNNIMTTMYRIPSWRLDSFHLSMPLISVQNPSDTLELKGMAYDDRSGYIKHLDLSIVGRSSSRVYLYPDDVAMQTIDSARARLRRYREKGRN